MSSNCRLTKVSFCTAHTAMGKNVINDVEKDQLVTSAENDKRKQFSVTVAKTLLQQFEEKQD